MPFTELDPLPFFWFTQNKAPLYVSVTECILLKVDVGQNSGPHRSDGFFRIRLFTKRIIQQLSVNTDIYFRPR